MKQDAVQIGNQYEARVSGRVVTVKVLGEAERRTGRVQSYPYDRSARGCRQWRVRNLATGREITVTAARLRALPVAPERAVCPTCCRRSHMTERDGTRVLGTHGRRDAAGELERCPGSGAEVKL